MRIATAREGESGIRLVTNKERITTPSILKPRKKWLPSCKISGLSRLKLANRHSKEESQRV